MANQVYYRSTVMRIFCKLAQDSTISKEFLSEFKTLSATEHETILLLADQHGLSAIVYKFLVENRLSTLIDTKKVDNLHEKVIRNATRNLIFLNEANSLLTAFNHQKIKIIGLKGLYLLDNVYDDISLRRMSDIDLMVKKEDIPVVLTICQDLGYHPTTYFDVFDENIDIKHVPPLKKENGPYLEIHWTILEENEPFLIDIAGLWERAVPAKIAGEDALALCLEDLILHLCIHLAYQHHFNIGLRGLVDIAKVINQHEGKVDWQQLTEIAKAWHAQKVVALTLHLLETVLAVTIPADIYHMLLSQPIPAGIIAEAQDELLGEDRYFFSMTPDLARLSSEKGLVNQLGVILSRVFLPKTTIARLYNIHPRSWKIYLYYPVRFWDLLRYYGSAGWGMFTKKQQVMAVVERSKASNNLKHWFIEVE